MRIDEELKNYCNKIYNNNYLAYLGLTTKIENPLRDNFAFFLNTKFEKEYIISREFSNDDVKRIDLAILDNDGKLLTSIEFKACYYFNIFKKNQVQYKKEILKDFEKYKECSSKYNSLFILLAVRVEELPSSKYRGIVKYYSDMDKAFRINNNSSEYYTNEISNIKNWFSNEDPLEFSSSNTVEIGLQFGVSVHLDYFIFKIR